MKRHLILIFLLSNFLYGYSVTQKELLKMCNSSEQKLILEKTLENIDYDLKKITDFNITYEITDADEAIIVEIDGEYYLLEKLEK